ncbi:hypothetical protein RFH42_00215 [Acinetobacter rudis]|uniref:hypothetical protein n=1 Tax=Acinetobacter rudis TaxID=632955 RepID=UPI00280D4992|nr:hypothetical protein [Acinetobacter rudis]MDQ8951394.1 hypothetical protein [Acinetobacter rudis]
MRSLLFIIILIAIYQKSYAQDDKNHCNYTNVKLDIYSRDDIRLSSKNCDLNADNQYIESFLLVGQKKIIVNKIYGGNGGGAGIELLAASIYKKKYKEPVLIMLYVENYCCYPQPSGKLYTIELYKVFNIDNNIKIEEITKILNGNSTGLEGVSDDYMHFKYKNIASIKRWLDKHY